MRSNMTEQKFNQEFACEFLGSTNTVVSAKAIQRLFDRLNNNDLQELALKDCLRIYEYPNDRNQYLIGTDPSKGTGKHDACIQVLKLVQIEPIVKLKQVAVFKSNKTNVYDFASTVNKISNFYKNSLILLESNGEGSAVAQHLWYTFENSKMYNESGKYLGINANIKSKYKAILLMKNLIEQDSIDIKDENTIKQLATYIEDDKGNCHAQSGMDDDLITSLYWACYALELNIFNESQNLIDRSKEQEEDIWGILTDYSVDSFEDNSIAFF